MKMVCLVLWIKDKNFLHGKSVSDHQQVFIEEEMNDCGLRKTKYSEKLYMKNKPSDWRLSLERLQSSPPSVQEDPLQNYYQRSSVDEEIIDCGLRKTKFSDKLYTKHKREENLESIERLVSPPNTPEEGGRPEYFPGKTTDVAPKQKEKSFTAIPIGTPRQNVKTEKSFGEYKPSSRTRSVERKSEGQRSPRKTINGDLKKEETKLGTWNGRPKTTRASLTADTYVSPFTRNTTGEEFALL